MENEELRKGPWTDDEDSLLINYITLHGEGHWNSLASSAGLKRTGKSCRLRWLNYLRPDVRRGNITLQEQLLILELHSRLGNRWSKIAEQLPGRTDNEIKNYWRTRVQKHAKQLKCDVDSQQFKDTMRYLWIPRLAEKIQSKAGSSGSKHVNATPISSKGFFDETEMGKLEKLDKENEFEIASANPSLYHEMPVSSSTLFEQHVLHDSYHNEYVSNDFGSFQNGSVSYPENLEFEYDNENIFEKDEDIWFLLQQLD